MLEWDMEAWIGSLGQINLLGLHIVLTPTEKQLSVSCMSCVEKKPLRLCFFVIENNNGLCHSLG